MRKSIVHNLWVIMPSVFIDAIIALMVPTAFAQVDDVRIALSELEVQEVLERNTGSDSISVTPMTLDLNEGFMQNQPSGSFLDYKSDQLNLKLSNKILENTGSTLYSFPSSDLVIFKWTKGGVVTNGSSIPYPGLMQIDRGQIGIEQNLGRFRFYVGGNATKYAYLNGLHTQYGVNGSITYRVNDKVNITAFGNYYFGNAPRMSNGMPLAPALLGYFNASRFGGYVDYRFSDNFGVEVGTRMVEQIGQGPRCYEPEPIVTPYWSPGGRKSKVKIGLPVGQIFYHILKR